MLALKSPGWKTLLIERVGRPLEKPAGASDAAKSTAYENELFWQTTSAEVLGELRDVSATKSLLKVLMDPAKVDVAPAAALGIVAIGKEAVPVLLDVLAGKDAELVELAKSKAADNGGNAKGYVAAAAVALGEVGRVEARDALVKALKVADHDANRAALARALTQITPNPDALKAFQAAYEKLAPGAKARPALLAFSVSFYDPALVPWLLKQVKAATGAEADAVRAAGLRAAIALTKDAQAPAVGQVVDKVGDDRSKEAFRAISPLIGSCDVAIDCYETKLVEAQAGTVGAKAAHMLGALGDAKEAERMVHRLADIKTADARLATLAAVDHLAQQGGPTLTELEKRMQAGLPAEEHQAARRLMLRLRAR
jgi:hypothetical protein